METIKRYFVYVRKSTEDKDKQVASISSQIDELSRLAERMNYQIVEVFQESKSAKAPDVRVEFYKMLDRIKKGEAEGILCWKLDRLARNPVDGGKINWMLQEGIIKHIKTFDRDYLPGDNTLMATLEFGMANQFIIDLRNNTLRGMRAKASKGVFPSRAPLGYKNEITGKQGENRIFIDEKRFDSIRQLWDLLLSGKYSIGEITLMAQKELGVTGMKGGPISDSVLYKLFGNPFYYGVFLWQKKIWEGTHAPMITKEEFNKAQKIIKRKG
ncbi:MAG: recombinase family protein, partial [Candidatus Nomurabacteria bacterium]|nr:recombinase family protein [Candidatus Nomurabacteria bacterium]